MDLTDNLVKGVFDNVRNFLLSSVVIAAGILIFREAPQTTTMAYSYTIGLVAVLIGFSLFALNAAHGWKKFTELKISKVYLVVLQVIYALLAIEIVGKLFVVRVGL
ncbi:MAG: hypothetical protein HY273_03290 [Gammaproteobacteria bacterium]|nr:hypothetical protein [Gammaproteobacteria bacterium]